MGPVFHADAVNSESDVRQMLQVSQNFHTALFLQSQYGRS
jgi:hypothetical protein